MLVNKTKRNLVSVPKLQIAKSPESAGGYERFRQTRYLNEDHLFTVTIGDRVGTIKNWSRTGVGFEFPSEIQGARPGSSIEDVTVRSGDIIL